MEQYYLSACLFFFLFSKSCDLGRGRVDYTRTAQTSYDVQFRKLSTYSRYQPKHHEYSARCTVHHGNRRIVPRQSSRRLYVHALLANAMVATSVVVGTESSSSLPVNTIAAAHCSNATNSHALDLDSIAPIVNAGFRAVLAEASKLGVLDPPHGRTPMPDPKKITDEDPFASDDGESDNGSESEKGTCATTTPAKAGPSPSPGGARNDNEDDDEDCDEKLLEYKFDYGFNSLVFLGEYLRRNNPVAIRARNEQHDANLEYLQQRAARCLGREAVFVELNELVVQRRSGIVHGPIVGEVSDCGGIMWARAFRPGMLGRWVIQQQ